MILLPRRLAGLGGRRVRRARPARAGTRVWRSTYGILVLVGVGLAGAAATGLAGGQQGHVLPDDYWRLPLAEQGPAPQNWSESERSLAPEVCGTCHADRYEEWRTSLHAQAFSPGLVGQLLTFDAAQAAGCMECHAPLAEQRLAFEAARARNEAHSPAGQGLAAAGNGCAGCHLRGHRRFGPPDRETGATGPGGVDAPHGGVFRTADFEASEFCGTCHQFPQAAAVNGKPLQNTYAEWRTSPASARGITCQGCHMPDRRHLWRGIHDPAMVISGLTADFGTDAQKARFTLTNSGVGHAFPTYITPSVAMRAVALDAAGRPRPDTAVSRIIRRVVAFAAGRWVERSDTRLMPGESVALDLPWGDSNRIRMWLEIHPDDYYDNEVYDALLGTLPAEGSAARLIEQADARAAASRYRLFERDLERPERTDPVMAP